MKFSTVVGNKAHHLILPSDREDGGRELNNEGFTYSSTLKNIRWRLRRIGVRPSPPIRRHTSQTVKGVTGVSLAVCLMALAFTPVLPGVKAATVQANDKTTKELMPWLKKLLPQATSFKNVHIGLPDPAGVGKKTKALGASLKEHDFHPTFHIGIGKTGQSVGIVFFTLTKDNSDFGLALDPSLTVLSAQGFSGSFARISPAFLAQFKGKSLATPLIVGKNISPMGTNPALAKEAAGQVKKIQFILDAWKQSLKKPGAHKGHSGH